MAAKGSSAEVKYPWMGIRPACSDSDEDFEIVGPRKHVKPEVLLLYLVSYDCLWINMLFCYY